MGLLSYERRCEIISTMITATGLHASEIVTLRMRDLATFETRVIRTIRGPTRPGRAKEIFFSLLCKGHRISPTMVVKYSCLLWLSHLCLNRGPNQITAQAIWETGLYTRNNGPFGRTVQTAQECGWAPMQGWWGWKVPGQSEPLMLNGDKQTVKHEVRE